MSIDKLAQTGLAGPFDLAEKAIAGGLKEIVLEINASRENNAQVNPQLIDRHRDIPVIREILFDRSIQSKLVKCFGLDLLLWRSIFIANNEGSREASWQHSRRFENGDAPLDIYDTSNHFSVLLAITDMRFTYVLGSHLPLDSFNRDQLDRHIMEFPISVQKKVTEVALRQGQFVLFHSSLLHRNQPIVDTWPGMLMVGRLVRAGTVIPERFGTSVLQMKSS